MHICSSIQAKTLSGLLIQPMTFERLQAISKKLKQMQQRTWEEHHLKTMIIT